MTDLAKMRTSLANQRTHLAYVRTGFAITGIAVTYNSNEVALIGVVLVLYGCYQYYTIAGDIEKNKFVSPNKEIPLLYSLAGLLALYYYFSKPKA